MRNDCGAGTVLILAASAVVGVLGLTGVTVTQALVVRHEVAGAADLAALAAAAAAKAGGSGQDGPPPGSPPGSSDPPCAVAERVATANQALLVACVVDGSTVRVEVVRRVSWLGRGTTVRAQARAGPGPSGGVRAQPTGICPSITPDLLSPHSEVP